MKRKNSFVSEQVDHVLIISSVEKYLNVRNEVHLMFIDLH